MLNSTLNNCNSYLNWALFLPASHCTLQYKKSHSHSQPFHHHWLMLRVSVATQSRVSHIGSTYYFVNHRIHIGRDTAGLVSHICILHICLFYSCPFCRRTYTLLEGCLISPANSLFGLFLWLGLLLVLEHKWKKIIPTRWKAGESQAPVSPRPIIPSRCPLPTPVLESSTHVSLPMCSALLFSTIRDPKWIWTTGRHGVGWLVYWELLILQEKGGFSLWPLSRSLLYFYTICPPKSWEQPGSQTNTSTNISHTQYNHTSAVLDFRGVYQYGWRLQINRLIMLL